MKDDYSHLDWSKAKKNPFAKQLKEAGRYTTRSIGKDFDIITEIEVGTSKTLSETKVYRKYATTGKAFDRVAEKYYGT